MTLPTPRALPASGAAGQNPDRSLFHLFSFARLPLYLAFALTVFGGVFLLHRSAAQARDTTRKHHLQDIEDSLYVALSIHGAYPPYGQPSWCGYITPESPSDARLAIEDALRHQINLYANPAKSFPEDPLPPHQNPPYFYWKHSPSSFELYANLETTVPDEYLLSNCTGSSPAPAFNYRLTSVWRER